MLSQTSLQLIIVLLGVAGLGISSYLHHKKKTAVESMACPMDGSCEDVITSKYSKFLGCDVEIFGILYYTTIILAYSIFLSTTQAVPSWFTFGVLLTTTAAVLFSLYLTFIQAFTLKMWCTWCVTSAAVCAAILGLAIPAAAAELPSLMAEYATILYWTSILGAAAGLGTVLSYNILFMNSLKDFEINDIQASMLNTLNHLTWFALAILVVSSAGLVIGDISLLNAPFLLSAAFITGVIVLNDSFYSLFLSEKLINISYSEEEGEDEPVELREYAIMLGLMSLYSWTVLLTVKILEPAMEFNNQASIFLAGLAITGLIGLSISRIENMRAKDELPDWSPLH